MLQKDLRVRCEIVAHSRFLTSMDLHPERDELISVSEDCSLNVWELPFDNGTLTPEVLMSTLWPHAMITGAVFSQTATEPVLTDSIAAVAYDIEELALWRLKN